MRQDEIDAIPRKEARQLLAQVPAGPGYDDRVLLAVEQAMNLEWWRGWHAANRSGLESLAQARDALIKIRQCSIAGATEGYGKPELWGDALFASHADVARALKTIEGVLSPPPRVPV